MKRRAVTLLAVLALGASVLTAAPAAAAEDLPPGAPYVAIGDSEAAGTGNLPYVDQGCLRSAKSYPMLLGSMLGGVASKACAGATTTDVIATQLGDIGPATQLVTVTAGVNNLGWQEVLAACSSAGNATDCATEKNDALVALQGVPMGIAQIVGAVRMRALGAMIVVTGYPELFGDTTRTCSVGAYQGTPVKFTAQQAREVNVGLLGVNAAVKAGVDAYKLQTGDPGVTFVDVVPGFDGHGLCDTGDRWISGLASGKATSDKGFHPNVAGQQAYARIVGTAIGL